MVTDAQVNEIYRYTVGLFKAAPGAFLGNLEAFVDAGNSTQDMALALAGSEIFTGLTSGYSPNASNSVFATTFINNLVGTTLDAATKQQAVDGVVDLVANQGFSRAQAVVAVIDLLATVDPADATFGAARQLFDARIERAVAYNENPMYNSDPQSPVNPLGLSTDIPTLQSIVEQSGVTFNIDDALPSVMRITGDQAVRIDFTNPANQVTGLDINGDGQIAADGIENAISGKASNFTVIDAYSRNPLNQFDNVNNFLGAIEYDGTGFDGDGVSTDGNIFLGGLGADTARAGIGNDFLAGGGVAGAGVDSLFGGRNADFFFASLSDLTTTDGDSLQISGGQTTDDSAVVGDTAMDSDWLLLEVADDEDGTVINLADGGDLTGDGDGTSTDLPGGQFVLTGDSGAWIWMTEIENVDASGNLYGFLDAIDVALGEGGTMVNGENVGIGATSQLNIIGSGADNIFIGGFDNDLIQGNAGNDLLFGGNLDYNNNPNTQLIVNDGVDELYGGAGNDHIVFEADGGIYEGDSAQDADGGNNDTLWLTDLALGTQTVEEMTTDSVLRFDLSVGLAGGLNNASGYGGADEAPDANGLFTADQTNYAAGVDRGAVQDMENVIATGLGAVDYLAAGTNDPELNFNNQQNIQGYEGDLHLRGTGGDNTLYANTGDDVLEGRTGDDNLSGGEGNDDFIFALDGDNGADGLDVIHRQTDIGNNITDGTFGRDFGLGGETDPDHSYLYIDISASDIAAANKELNTFSIDLGGETFEVTDVDALEAATNAAEVAAVIAEVFAGDSAVTVSFSGNVITIEDASGREFDNFDVTGRVVGGGESFTNPVVSTEIIEGASSEDRLIFASYEDRADGELVDDDGMVNSTGDAVTLGADAYAEDLVVRFDADGNGTTVLAEDQQWNLDFINLADEDTVTISVNGTAFSLQMGVAADGTAIGETMAQFLQRMVDLINAGSDNDTLAGTLVAATDGVDTISLTQGNYYGGQVAFMDMPVVTLGNASGGEPASVAISQTGTDSEITLFEFDGRNAALNADNVLFLGGSGMNNGVVTNADNSRSVLATAAAAGGELLGSDALVVDSMTDADTIATDFSLHGDDLLFGGAGDDVIAAGTGDDRIFGSAGMDRVDGGKDLYVVQSLVAGQVVETVETLNAYDAAQRLAATDVVAVALLEQDSAAGPQAGFVDHMIFSTADFAGTRFTITIDNDLQQQDGGAGTVGVDEGDDGTIDHTTIFTEMEAIRTLAGDGTHAGQGHDTLNVEALSNAVAASDAGDTDAAVVYNMTSALGFVQINADLNNDDAIAAFGGADTNATFIAVDGVERLIGGNANETLNIDESEVNKDNYFDGDDEVTSTTDMVGDSIVYNHTDMDNDNAADAGAGDTVALSMRPSLEIVVESDTETDLVNMTGGTIIGRDTTVDTLVDVETVDVTNAAFSLTLDDTINVANVAGGYVDYAEGKVGTSDADADDLIQIGGMTEMENVEGSTGADTVVLANAMTNTRAADAPTAISYATFLDYDDVEDTNGDGVNDARVAFSDIAADDRAEANNQALFTFDLGAGQDRVDYANETGAIAVVVDLEDGDVAQTVLVDEDGNATFDAIGNNVNDRIDLLQNVEEVVASQGLSILDFTGADTNLSISYMSAVDATGSTVYADTREHTIAIEDLDSSVPFSDLTYIELMDNADGDAVVGTTALWNQIEGSDYDEKIELTDDQSANVHIFKLRGGDNEVNYNELTRGIVFAVTSVANGVTAATVQALDTAGNAIVGGVDTITSYNENNPVTDGSLRIEASQSEEDLIDMSGLQNNNLFVLGTKEGLADIIEVKVDTTGANVGITLTGFESLLDSAGDDVYEIEDLSDFFATLSLVDTAGDSDTLKLTDDALESVFGVTWGDGSIEMDDFEDSADGADDGAEGFDFDTLDISALTEDTDRVSTDDTGETVILGDLGNFGDGTAAVDVVGFETIKFSTTAGMGTDVVIDMDNSEFRQADGTVLFQFDSAVTFDFSAITSDMTVTVVDDGAAGVEVIGGAGNDTITGADGDDTLQGGAGNDVLDGGFTAEVLEVHSYTLSSTAGGLGLGAGQTVIINGVTVTEGVASQGIVVAEDDADAIGAAFVREWDINPGGFDVNNTDPAPNTITSVTYDALTNVLSFTFASGMDPANGLLAAVGGTAVADVSLVNVTDYVPQLESADTYVFEATAAANGVDTINNFDLSDVLNFDALLVNAAALNAAVDNTSILNINIDNDVQLFDNKGTALTAATLAAEFAGGGTAFSAAAYDVAVVIEIDSTATAEDANIWYVSDADGDGVIADTEVALVGVVSEAGDLVFTLVNF